MYIVNSYVFEIKNGKMRPGIDEYGCSGKGQKGFKKGSKGVQKVVPRGQGQWRFTRGSSGGQRGGQKRVTRGSLVYFHTTELYTYF